VKALTPQELEAFFRSLESDWDVRVPVRLHDGTRALGRLDEGPLALEGGHLPRKPTEVFFPQIEQVLTAGPDGVVVQGPPAKPLLVVGFTAQDADCLEFIDRFFSAEYRDDVYFNKRDGSVVVCVSGRCGADGELLKIAGGKCDLELICDGRRYLVAAYSQAGKALAERISGGEEAPAETLAELQGASDALPTDDLELLEAASKLILEEKVPEEFWQGVADRCIACTSCNLVCPTCTCFDVLDRTVGQSVQRWRLWDSCQLDGFMREASGHNPMGQEHQRTRRRIHHKLAADVARWGHITCYLCGRCDEACPTGIGIKAVCREMVEKYGSA
jgi:sulfhydrogenase subunit beta (sulfur reductase)